LKLGYTRSTKSISWSAGSNYECSSRWLFSVLTCQGQAAIKILGWPRWALIAFTLFWAHCHMIYGSFLLLLYVMVWPVTWFSSSCQNSQVLWRAWHEPWTKIRGLRVSGLAKEEKADHSSYYLTQYGSRMIDTEIYFYKLRLIKCKLLF